MAKRILLLLSLLALLLMTCSCAGEPTATVSGTVSTAASEAEPAFTPPENYATVVRVTINPEFNLYLDSTEEVLAVEAVNADAEQLMDRIRFAGRKVDGVVQDIVATAIDDGFLKNEGAVNVEIIQTELDEIAIKDILTHAEEAVERHTKEVGVTVHTETRVAEDAYGPAEEPVPASETPATSSKATVSKQATPSKQTASSKQAASSKPTTPSTQPASSQAAQGGKVEGCSVCQGSGKCGHCGAKGRYACEVCGGKGYETCHRCGGVGKMKCNCNGGKCHVCLGAGKLKCNLCDGSDRNCPYCHGTGYGNCNGCPGDGLCTQCKGTTYSGIDEQCNGTGKEACHPCNGTGITDCNQCHGSKKCPACNGTGKKPN